MDWSRTLHDPITIWRTTPNDYGGYDFAAPEHTVGRWQEGGQIFRTLSGDELVSQAVAYLTVDVGEGDWMAPGTFSDTDPSGVQGAFQVMRFYRSPDLRNMDMTRKAVM